MTSPRPTIAVLGASGFVGSAVVSALVARGALPRPIKTPRVTVDEDPSADQLEEDFASSIQSLLEQLADCEAVINCAGQPDASSRDLAGLRGANAAVPGIAAAAARKAGTRRFVHVSSAVVQGRKACLDSSMSTDPFSAYASSKISGERLALDLGPISTVVYRPPSVHDSSRRVSRMTATIARSRLACVAAPGTANSPQAHILNVGDIIAFLALHPETPPSIVTHPSEGLTTAGLMEVLGGRRPFLIPRPLAQVGVKLGELAGRGIPALAANARRIEMLWFGQEQADSWASLHGWMPPAGNDGWKNLAEELRSQAGHPQGDIR